MDAEEDAAAWAESGVAALSGRGDGPPLLPPGSGATAARQALRSLAASTESAVLARLDGARLLSERAAFTGCGRRGRTSVGGACRLLPTADGWAAVSCARPDDPALLGALVGTPVGADPWPPVTAWLRDHTGAELAERAELLGLAAGPVNPRQAKSPLERQGTGRSVRDALVVDFSALWAGPLCAHLLGLAGARVVKVETPDRPDGARRGNPDFYRLLHAGHRSVVLAPTTSGGRKAMAALVAAADIVIEASRPRALARFGLNAAASTATGTTWISITAYGRAADRVGFGDDVAAASGLVCRDIDGTPLFAGDAIADPLTGVTAAALAASVPPGTLLDIAMADVIAATLDGPATNPSPPLPSAPPSPRAPSGEAPLSGRDTTEVLQELRIPLP
ncbi:CoA transferase [Actinomadura parmotrematis]|uniref:CoA transferase n=1 Tax=Actinomadura parmotrematis TaxID=2864039 RepID=A0ABS7FSY4_9ACTN|nr:CoA transferase [Actinomadura parmotrematis]MBW8482697.1 CoA transferase [Actinomadura parmotrematis]